MPDRELGGYTNANALAGGGPSAREIDVVISPAAATLLAAVEQTFTVPGVLATDRCVYANTTTGPSFGTSAGALGQPRVSAVSVVAIPFINAGTTAANPTTSQTYAFLIAAARAIP